MQKQFVVALLLGAGAVWAQGQSTFGVVWQEVPGNPAMVGGPCLSWRCAGVSDPTMFPDASGNLLVWFTTVGIGQDATGGYFADGPYIGRAKGSVASSSAMSFSPERATLPVGPQGSWDRYVETPTVRRIGDSQQLTMWYTGYAAPDFTAPAIGQMTSTDLTGTAWTHPSAPIYRPQSGAWDGILVTGPTVVFGPDGIWRLYYTGLGTADGIGLLTSTDGINWTPYANNPVLLAQPGAWDDQILEQSVVYANGQYWMWYSGFKGQLQSTTSISIGLATSTDGIRWTRYAKNPVLKPGVRGSWDDQRVLAPDVMVQPDGSLLMVAYGQSRYDIGKTAGSIGFWRSH